MSKVSFKTLSKIAGPLIFVEGVKNAAYGEMVEIKLANGEIRQGQVLDYPRRFSNSTSISDQQLDLAQLEL